MTNTKPSNYVYQFDRKFEERNIQTKDGKKLNSLLFKSDLHGGGTLLTNGANMQELTPICIMTYSLDYRGFGKSEGNLPSEKQLYSDVQDAYNDLRTSYKENNIVVFGYSFGTAPASMLAADNNSKMLILQAHITALTKQ